MLPFVSLLPPCLAGSVSYPGPSTSQPPLLFPRAERCSSWIRAPYLDTDLSFLCTATGEKKILNPCLPASLPFPRTRSHSLAHTHTPLLICFLSAFFVAGGACSIPGWQRLEGSKLTPAASISQRTANLLPARSLCLPAVDTSNSSSSRQSCRQSPGLEETGRSSYRSGTSLCTDPARSTGRTLPAITSCL